MRMEARCREHRSRITSTASSLTKREATTDEQGFYRVGALDPGSYNVVVEKDGFERLENATSW